MQRQTNVGTGAVMDEYYEALTDVMTAATDEEMEHAQKRIESLIPGIQDRLKTLPREQRYIIFAGDTIERHTAALMDMENSDGYKDWPR